MAGLRGLISDLISRGTFVLPTIRDSLLSPWSSSSSHEIKLQTIEGDLERLMRMLKRIQATLRDAEKREIRDESVQCWVTELREVAYAADDVLDEWRYEQVKAQVEARNASDGNPNKRKLIQIPNGIEDQIKEIRSRFDEICKHREALHLREEDGVRILEAARSPIPTGHLPHESNIFGRKNEKDELINHLLSNCDNNNLIILPIVGMGGLGKTTLAQLVYNGERVGQQFDKKGWVQVFNGFDVERLTKAILECVSGHRCSKLTELSMLQGQLKTNVANKSVFLVLDDVWNDQHSLWQCLMAPLISAKRVSILVTTRNQSVALVVQTVPFFKLEALPDEHCGQIFQHYALGGFPNIERSNLKELGRRIMNKCNGLPLAVKSIASLLRYENDERWEEILQSEIWEVHPENEAFATLHISYMRLPEHLKSCLLFCSMFPKGHCYEADMLINLWIANDYVVSRGQMSMEEVGIKYVEELRQRSFLEVTHSTTIPHRWLLINFTIHDVVHDLLHLISRGAHRGIQAEIPGNTTNEICYHLYVQNHSDLIIRYFLPQQVAMLRTLILCEERPLNDMYLCHVQKLRALEIFHWNGIYLLYQIGRMKHLRHLVLDYCNSNLEPIWQLFNLRSLSLKHCTVKVLPEEFGNLVNLISLSLSYCRITSLPESIGLLSNLLRLYIGHCRLKTLPENLGKLVSLRELRIHGCPLETFPDSLCELSNVKTLKFQGVDNFKWRGRPTKLPEAIGNLSSLQELSIRGNFGCLPPSFNKIYNYCRSTKLFQVGWGISWLKNFKDLQGTLCLGNLQYLNKVRQDHVLVDMHRLQELMVSWFDSYSYITKIKEREIENILCVSILEDHDLLYSDEMHFPILESLRPHPNLKQLTLHNYSGNMLPSWMGDPHVCASVHTIDMQYCNYLSSLPFVNLRSLRKFVLSGCRSLSSLDKDSLPSQLEQLHVSESGNLICMPVLSKLVCLVNLSISSCSNLKEPFIMESDCDTNHWLPPATCNVDIQGCPLLEDWCVQQGILYKPDGICFDD